VRTETVKIDPDRPDPRVLDHAADVLARGGVVGIPTETFYGLAARALDATAVRRVFEVKGRPASSPLLVLVDSPAMAARVATVTEQARSFMARHWPGALTLVLPAREGVPASVTAGTGTIGVRMSSHRVATGLVTALEEPVTAPSANPTGQEPPTTAGEVLRHFDGRIDLVLDSGPTAGGLPSTVLDLTIDPPRVLRPGAVRLHL
jgi:L-threonylcarbamoyladenylate synthase